MGPRKFRLSCLAALLVLGGAFLAEAASTAITLNIGIKGDSIIHGHEGEITVLALSLGETFVTKPSCQDVSFVKNVDRASPQLFRDSFSNRSIPAATFQFLDTSATNEALWTIKLDNVTISSFQLVGQAGKDIAAPTENITLRWERIHFTDELTHVTTGWDCFRNRGL
jgi:type VI secretion system Hcp family effector